MNLKVVVWNNEELYGCEYLTMRRTHENIFVQSTVMYIDKTNKTNKMTAKLIIILMTIITLTFFDNVIRGQSK